MTPKRAERLATTILAATALALSPLAINTVMHYEHRIDAAFSRNNPAPAAPSTRTPITDGPHANCWDKVTCDLVRLGYQPVCIFFYTDGTWDSVDGDKQVWTGNQYPVPCERPADDDTPNTKPAPQGPPAYAA